MAKIDITYHNLLDKILQEGYTYEDPNRKGVNRIEIPSYTFKHEFKDGFPAISTKKLHYKNVATELIWFLRGDTNIKYLVDNGCNIWNKDAYNYYLKWLKSKRLSKEDFEMFSLDFKEFITTVREGFKDKDYTYGDLGPVYGAQWRNWQRFGNDIGIDMDVLQPIDQIQKLINNLKEKPLATDHIVNAWNVGDLENMALQPCHYGFQIVMKPLFNDICDEVDYLEKIKIISKKDLHLWDKLAEENAKDSEFQKILNNYDYPKYGFELHWQQRSVDTFLGLPYNIASYATLALIIEKITGYKALAIQGDLKKVHLYDNSLDAVKEQLSRDVDKYSKCELKMDTLTEVQFQSGIKYINEIEPGSFKLVNYESYPALAVEMLERDE